MCLVLVGEKMEVFFIRKYLAHIPKYSINNFNDFFHKSLLRAYHNPVVTLHAGHTVDPDLGAQSPSGEASVTKSPKFLSQLGWVGVGGGGGEGLLP